MQGEVSSSEVSKEMACTRINAVVGEASSSNLGDDAAKVRACISETTRRLGNDFFQVREDVVMMMERAMTRTDSRTELLNVWA